SIRGMRAETQVDAEGRYALTSLPAAYGILTVRLLPIDGFPQGSRQISIVAIEPPSRTLDIGDGVPLPVWRGRVVEGDGTVAKGPGQFAFSDPAPRAGPLEWRL